MRNILTFIMLIWSVDSFACSCRESSLEDHVKRAKHIFIARIYSVEDVKKVEGAKDDARGVRAKFESYDTLKGNPEALTYLYSGYGHGDCGLNFTVGDRYLFFTTNGHVSYCGASEKNFNNWHESYQVKYKKLKELIATE
jgi:hypothetical protein